MPGQINRREITQELQESYLDYAMSVIVSRALPDVRDGLKPVQRRVLWAMWESGVVAPAKHRKSANIVGETLGRYHPHSDVAVYDTLVRLAQEFSLRYPLVHGQGNFGSVDGDSAAAMRYTEARMSKLAAELLTDIEKETVDFIPNYDGTRTEPRVLPAKLPNLILNGSMGIAVGMATNIPPHNLREVVDAILYLADHPDAEVKDLMQFVQGPDFPTGGFIFDKKAIEEAYRTGRGSIPARAKAEIQERKSGHYDIVITEIPYLVNKSELIKKIAELTQEKKLDGIRNLRDESDREGMRIMIELKGDAVPQKVLNQLYKHTDLQKDFHFNMIALADGLQPQLMSLKDILAAYLTYRKQVVAKRTQFELKKAKEREHILEGLAKALSVIDKIIATIKASADKDEARVALMKKFTLSELQANAILEMRLSTLSGLERKKIEDELKEKRELIKELELLLKSHVKILGVIKKELMEAKEKYGDDRRTKVVKTGLTEFNEEDLIPDEEQIITLSQSGYIKRVSPDSFRTQRRGGKGLIGSEVADEDFVTHFLTVSTHDNVLFFTDRGRVFQTKAYEIPAGSRTSKGKAVHNFLELPATELVSAIVSYSEKNSDGQYLIMVTRNGLIKKTPLTEFANIRRNGIIALNLGSDDSLKGVRLCSTKDQVMLVTKLGQSIRFAEAQVRPMGRTAAGVRAIRVKKGDAVAGFDIIPSSDREKEKTLRVLVVAENGFAKQTALKEYKLQKRGGSGIRTAVINSKTGSLVASAILAQETDLFALSAKGQIIRTTLASVRATGRAAQGVRIMQLKSGDRLAGVAVV